MLFEVFGGGRALIPALPLKKWLRWPGGFFSAIIMFFGPEVRSVRQNKWCAIARGILEGVFLGNYNAFWARGAFGAAK